MYWNEEMGEVSSVDLHNRDKAHCESYSYLLTVYPACFLNITALIPVDVLL